MLLERDQRDPKLSAQDMFAFHLWLQLKVLWLRLNLLGPLFSVALPCLAGGSYSGIFYLGVRLRAHSLVNADLIYHSLNSET